MNVRLELTSHFLAGVFWEEVVLFNNYQIRCELITCTRNNVEQNIALERLKYIIWKKMENSVFINAREKMAIKRLEAAGMRTIALPEQPVDQIIGMMLYSKLDSVMEDRLRLTQLSLSSEIGDNVWYLQNELETIGPFSEDGWWNDPEPICSDKPSRNGKIVNIHQSDSWQSLDLQWTKNDDESSGNTIVAFRKDDNE